MPQLGFNSVNALAASPLPNNNHDASSLVDHTKTSAESMGCGTWEVLDGRAVQKLYYQRSGTPDSSESGHCLCTRSSQR